MIRKLYELDEVAYVRFASVYRSFKDINQFMEELRELLKDKETPKVVERAEAGHGSRLPLELIKSEGEE